MAPLSLLILGLAVASGDPDPSALVGRLGSARFAEREEAAKILAGLGPKALAPLRKAQEAKDPEVRARASALVEKIETDSLVKPTMVRLDFRDEPISAVVRAISEQSGIEISLQPENHPAWAARRLTLARPEPVRFWEAIGLLDEAAGVQSIPADLSPSGRRAGLSLVLGSGWTPGPKSEGGPFRSFLTNVRYSIDLNLGGPPARPGAGRLAIAGPRMAANEQFDAMIQIQVEPRMRLAASGPLKLIEALDDKGQSLIPPEASGPAPNRYMGGLAAQTYANSSIISVAAQLRRPDQPGRTIRVLKGTLPVVVSTRKEGPSVVSLAEAKAKPARVGDLLLSVVDFKSEPANNRHVIELAARPDGAPQGGASPGMLAFSSSQIEILDAQDRLYGQWYPQSARGGADESRMTLVVMGQDGLGPPAKLRYYRLSRASTEVGFDFRNLDVRMP